MKVVLDTNVLISGIFWKGTPHTIIAAWAENGFEVVISKKILSEYLAVLKTIDTHGDVAERWAIFITEHAQVVNDNAIVKLSRDADDDKFINAAITGKADYIISGDDDLLSLQGKSPVTIITPRAFLAVLRMNGVQ